MYVQCCPALRRHSHLSGGSYLNVGGTARGERSGDRPVAMAVMWPRGGLWNDRAFSPRWFVQATTVGLLSSMTLAANGRGQRQILLSLFVGGLCLFCVLFPPSSLFCFSIAFGVRCREAVVGLLCTACPSPRWHFIAVRLIVLVVFALSDFLCPRACPSSLLTL